MDQPLAMQAKEFDELSTCFATGYIDQQILLQTADNRNSLVQREHKTNK